MRIDLDWSPKPLRSWVWFKWDFEKTLESIVIESMEAIEWDNELNSFDSFSVSEWKNNLKIRVKDKKECLDKILNCVWRFDKDDRWYWNIHLEIATSEYSAKPKLHYVWKFNLSEKEAMISKLISDIYKKIKEI